MDSLHTYKEQTSSDTEASSSKSDLVQKIKKSLYKQERDRLWKIMKQVRQSSQQNEFFSNVVKVVQHEFAADRVLIYRFDSENTGKVVAEALVPGWTPGFNETLSCNCFGALKAADFQDRGFVAIESPDNEEVTPYQKQLFEKFQVQASLALPIMLDSYAQTSGYELDRAWGLIVVQQCQQPRYWQEDEINLLYQLTIEITRVLQSPLLSSRANAARDLVATMEHSMELSMEEMLHELRQNLKADRTLIYGFNPDGSGAILAESVDEVWKKGSNSFDNDCFVTPDNCQTKYICNDVSDKDLSPCFIEQIESLDAKAYIIVSIKSGVPQGGRQPNRLLGMLGVYQNSGARNWQTMEAEQIAQLASQLGIAIRQIDYYEQLRIQSENLAETVAREKAAREELQKQALDILTTVRPAFSGDLTVRAKVTKSEIGTVAGAYNTTLDSLKDIVEQVQTAASQVTETTDSSSSAIKGLSLQSERQLMELQEALDRVQSMIDASTVTTENAQKVEVAIEQANQTVMTGDQAMNNTVDSIVSIRDTVADAGKRVKRLSDSSQKISKVVSLISSFATQTNLLALNAALEATRAGEYGKGFAVVADEVRNLSLQSSEATTEIEKLVREIQEETQEVAAAMEAGVEQVAKGTNLVNHTRDSLNEIVIATAEIKDLVQGITSAANVQTQEAASVTQVMGQVAEIANETSQDSGKISISFEQLEQLAQNLQDSVSKFKVK